MMRFGAILAVFLGASTAAAMAADPALSPQANAAYLAAYAHKPGAVRTADGLEYRIIQHGKGARPAASDLVDVYYWGTLINGKLFDQTKTRRSGPVSRQRRHPRVDRSAAADAGGRSLGTGDPC